VTHEIHEGTSHELPLRGAVVAVAGAGGSAGAAVVHRLSAAGATVAMAGRSTTRLEEIAAEVAAQGGTAVATAVDLFDEEATKAWAAEIEATFGRIDGLVHLVGGWRGGKGITQTDLADWDLLANLLIRTVQHTSRAFHDALRASPIGRFVLVSAAAASHPTATNAAYSAAKAAAEAWTLAVADSFRGSAAAATVLVVNALVTPAMRAAKPNEAFAGLTDVDELGAEIVRLFDQPADEVNGERVWLTATR
jgi:NADP-dependent 3-hydroxy acid dehydrogenase YdfG